MQRTSSGRGESSDRASPRHGRFRRTRPQRSSSRRLRASPGHPRENRCRASSPNCPLSIEPCAMSIAVGATLIGRKSPHGWREHFLLDEPRHGSRAIRPPQQPDPASPWPPAHWVAPSTLNRALAADQSASRAEAFSLPVAATCDSSSCFSNEACASVVMLHTSTISD